MPRTTTPALDAQLNAQITSVGYLLRMETEAVKKQGRAPQTMQLCDIGQINNATLGSFQSADMTVQNAGTPQIDVSIQNLDGAIGAFVLNADTMARVRCTLWQVEREAPDDAVMLGVYLPRGCDIGMDRVRIQLVAEGLQYRFAPMRRINAAYGFKYALRPGEVLLWGSQRLFIKER
jgi:hypothetical protein